ncbi:MAG TPA: NADH-quinone oxidoreductase subunit H [Spirochaetota bacterium]|nr:NADH-quinone oxidoreductase subunit H [Spirochaetota bacterium]HPS86473.1 NADH-quinone oxidoreductase subunit H [Spirochaetota bacterium]
MKILLILNILIIIIVPLLFTGIINKTKAFWGGRKGASIFQPYYDFIKLMKKSEVISTVTSPVFFLFPVISLSTVIFAGFLLPLIDHKAVISFEGSFIMFAYILALGKFFSIIGALDTGSSFEGMGAAREAFFTSIPEPAFFIILGSISIFGEINSFENLFGLYHAGSELSLLIVVLTVIILFIILLVEGSRIPIDDPNTHLELTMIHEVMVLDNSGPSLALIQYGAAMKMMILSSLILNFIIPYSAGPLLYSAYYAAGIIAAAFTIGTVETLTARFRIVRIPDFIFTIVGMSLMVMFIILLYYYGGRR